MYLSIVGFRMELATLSFHNFVRCVQGKVCARVRDYCLSFCLVALFQLHDGFVEYSYGENSLMLDSVRVNDGQWHYIEARWYQNKMELWLDYGQRQVSVIIDVMLLLNRDVLVGTGDMMLIRTQTHLYRLLCVCACVHACVCVCAMFVCMRVCMLVCMYNLCIVCVCVCAHA